MADMVFLTKLKPEPMGKYNASKAYGINSLVMSEDGAAAYLSVKDVPAGTPLTNTEYWKIHTDLTQPKQSAEVAAERAIAARDEMWEALRNLTDPVAAEGNPVTAELVGGMPFDSVKMMLELKQAGSGDPSPSNIRPISGWTGAKMMHAGKNLVDVDDNNIGFTANILDLSCFPVGTVLYTKGYVETFGSNMNMKVANPTNGDYDDCVAASAQVWRSLNYIIREGDTYLRFYCVNSANKSTGFKAMVSLTDVPYEPYQGNDYSAEFEQTVYGGTLDWQTGVLTVDRALVTLDGTQIAVNRFIGTHGYMIVRYSVAGVAAVGSPDFDVRLTSSALKAVSADSQYVNMVNTIACNNSQDSLLVCIDGMTTEAEVTAWLAANPVQVVYPLANPTTIQLTPWQIKQLEGMNTLYGDALIRIEGRQDPRKAIIVRIEALEAAILNA